jgi:hypothetical protein
MEFWDWQSTDYRDFHLLGIVVERLDHIPEAIGHHAYVEMTKCSIFLEDDPPTTTS